MASALIEATELSKRFMMRHEQLPSLKRAFTRLFRRYPTEYLWALDGVAFSVGSGEAVGIVGGNGSGKSTLLRLIGGIFIPTAGELTVRGRTGGLFELAAGFTPDLNGRDNINLSGALMGYSRTEVARGMDSIIEFSELGDFIDVPVKTYSSGMALRLGFATAVAFEPEVLLVDEVMAVGDAHFQHKAYAHLKRLQQQGSAVLMVSHEMPAIRRMCGRVIWLEKGKLMADGPTDEVIGAYLSAMEVDNGG